MNVINSTNAKSINNVLHNLTNGLLQKNGLQISENKSGQGSFSNMLSMILGGTVDEQSITTGEFVSNEDFTNMMIFSSEDDKSTDQTEVDYGSIMNILFGCTAQKPICQINDIGIESSDMNSENYINVLNQIQNPINGLNITETNNLVTKLDSQDLKGYSIVGEKIYHELPATKEIANNSLDSSNKAIQNSIMLRNSLVSNKSDSNIQKNIFDKTTPFIENFNNTNENDMKSGINRINISKEVLPKEWDESQNDAKTNMEFGNLLDNKTLVFNENNKIIEVSDESTKIKDTILSQVEDKIIFMAKDKEGIQQVTMELNPKNLGKVSVKMSVESEKIIVEIMALDQKTNSILMSNAQELSKSLQNHFSNGSVTVTVTESVLNQYNQSNMNYSQQNSQREQNNNSQNLNNNINDLEEGSFIAEMINLRNFKLNTVV